MFVTTCTPMGQGYECPRPHCSPHYRPLSGLFHVSQSDDCTAASHDYFYLCFLIPNEFKLLLMCSLAICKAIPVHFQSTYSNLLPIFLLDHTPILKKTILSKLSVCNTIKCLHISGSVSALSIQFH